MDQVDALSGSDGMAALLDAFVAAGREFNINVMVATPAEGSQKYHLVFSIGDTSAAMTISETKWLADMLIHQTRGMGKLTNDLQGLGRMMLQALAEAPGAQGVH